MKFINKKLLNRTLKAIVWELTGVVIMYLITGNWNIIMWYFTVRITLYIPFHTLWKTRK